MEPELPVFSALVGNPLFPRDQLQHSQTGICKSVDDYADAAYHRLVAPPDPQDFRDRFRAACAAYTLAPDAEIKEVPLDTMHQQRYYIFEPGLEAVDASPAVLLLRPLRMRALHLAFGEMSFAEVWVRPGGQPTIDQLNLPPATQNQAEVLALPLMERLQVFETLSNLDLGPVMVFDSNYELSPAVSNNCWMYLAALTMAQLDGRGSFRRRDELQRLLAQFVCLSDLPTNDLPRGCLTLGRASLSHLFHSTLAHLSKLNTACGTPFPTYLEWELFDGTVFGMELDAIFALSAFRRNSRRYHTLLKKVEANLPAPLDNTPSPAPTSSLAQLPSRLRLLL
eukprot:TRINITY_DN7644_c0_g1_i2.p1 TRINITY_DN7644_c0_g1~~TRINITY_DN7644_c0_g1_i2.p1  ORF type:complete len:338 (-),score=69.50 TRINITY_DN7644_c0_g1_i2:31-1044(-)